MPEKDFIIWLDERTYIAVDFVTVRGRMVSFVIRLMLIEPRAEVNVARYDTAHGVPHRDEHGKRSGLLLKTWFPGQSPETVLEEAIKDFKQNYESYLERFARH